MPKECVILKENYNPIELLSYFKKVYTKTSGMGFEALLMNCECVCYGMPFYAGWGLTQDKYKCERRSRKLSLEELVVGALILYPRYINPRSKDLCEIELSLEMMLKMQRDYFTKWHIKMVSDCKTFIIRKIRRMIEFILKIQ